MKWKAAVLGLFPLFIVTESLAVVLAWLSSGFRALAIVTKRFGLPMRHAARRAQGYHRINGAWVKPGERINRRRSLPNLRRVP